VILSESAIVADEVLTQIRVARERFLGDEFFHLLMLVVGSVEERPLADLLDGFHLIRSMEDFSSQLMEVSGSRFCTAGR
jgi:hypothetical protein